MTGGGTGGHVNPALAIASVIRNNDPTSEIAFVGTPKGIENKLVGAAGYRMYHVEVKGFRRKLSAENLRALALALTSPIKARHIISDFKPDVVIGTGGYVSWPILEAAAEMHIPCAVHESNAVPGMTVRRLAKRVDRVYVNYEESIAKLPDPKRRCAWAVPSVRTLKRWTRRRRAKDSAFCRIKKCCCPSVVRSAPSKSTSPCWTSWKTT